MNAKLDRFTIKTRMGDVRITGLVSDPFALHFTQATIEDDTFAVTHVPTGFAVETGMSREDAEWLLGQCEQARTFFDGLESPAKMSPQLKKWGREVRKQIKARQDARGESA